MATVEQLPCEQRFVLHGVDWQTYVALRDAPSNEGVRMTFDRGELEMMSPSKRHESLGYLIGRLIDVWTEELNIDVQSCRTMTFRRADLNRGLEPDNCYYVQNEPRVWKREELDLSVDPPPDLAIEITVSKGPIDKMTIYAAYGVPELWRYDGQTLQAFELTAEGRYVPRPSSLCFPNLPLPRLEQALRQFGFVRETALVRSFRDWVRANFRTGDRA